MTRIHNIGHIHNANFVQTQFSTSHPQKQHFLKSWEFTFLWKYSVCGLKFEISEYPIKLLYVTYSPYKYELKRIKTHEMRAKNFRLNLFSVHCRSLDLAIIVLWHVKRHQMSHRTLKIRFFEKNPILSTFLCIFLRISELAG